MRFSNERALVLFKRPYKDKDEWVTLFVQDRGKVSALAYGSKSLTSRFRGVLEPLTIVDVGFAETDHYKNIREAKKLRGFGNIGAHLGPTYHAFYLLELLHNFLPEEVPEPALFGILLEVLSCVERQVKPHLSTLYFAMQLYSRLGFFPAFAHCGDCTTRLDDQSGYLTLLDTMFTCKACLSASVHHEVPFRYVKLLNFLQTQPLERVLQVRLELADKEYLESFMEEAFRHFASRDVQSNQLRDQSVIHGD